MRVMALVKATKDTEAGVMPTQQVWTELDKFSEESEALTQALRQQEERQRVEIASQAER
jgi:hypothetical protein